MKGVALAAASSYAAYTLWLVARMFWFLYYSMTSAIRVDELVMMEEIRLFREGKWTMGYLWQPYFGQRLLIPRLLTLADERFFHLSNTPLVAVNMVAQCGITGVLLWTEWRALRDAPLWLIVAVLSATAHLALSSLQLETFAYGMDVPLTVGLFGACAAIVLATKSLGSGKRTPWIALAAFCCALLCALSQATSVFLGPVILLVAFGARARRRSLAALLLMSAIFAAIYAIGYSNSGNGMGVAKALMHPFEAIGITALALGGPITNQSLWWGGACGLAGMLLVAPRVIRLIRGGASRTEVALTGVCVFLLFEELGIAIGRYSPEAIAALGSNTMLPSRYLTPSFLYWGALLALVAATRRSMVSKGSLAIAGAMVAFLTLHTFPSQLDVSMAWLEFHRTLEVAGAGMIMGATDPKFMFELIPDQKALDHYRPYMQQRRFSFFADDRAYWIGRDLNRVFGDATGSCGGRIDARIPAGPSTFRIEGYVVGPGARFPLERAIVFSDGKGKIDGLGNTLATSEKRGGQDFVAYAGSGASASYLITSDGRACKFAD